MSPRAEAGLVSAIFASNGFLNPTQNENIFRTDDCTFIHDRGFAGGHLVEAVVTTALAHLLYTLQTGLGLTDL